MENDFIDSHTQPFFVSITEYYLRVIEVNEFRKEKKRKEKKKKERKINHGAINFSNIIGQQREDRPEVEERNAKTAHRSIATRMPLASLFFSKLYSPGC